MDYDPLLRLQHVEVELRGLPPSHLLLFRLGLSHSSHPAGHGGNVCLPARPQAALVSHLTHGTNIHENKTNILEIKRCSAIDNTGQLPLTAD